MTKFRKGDQVSVRGTIVSNVYDDLERVEVEFTDTYAKSYVSKIALTLITPVLEVGDRVSSGPHQGVIMSIDHDVVWVKHDKGGGYNSGYSTWHASVLERIETQPEVAQAAEPPLTPPLSSEVESEG